MGVTSSANNIFLRQEERKGEKEKGVRNREEKGEEEEGKGRGRGRQVI